MHPQTLDTHSAQQPETRQSQPAKPAKNAIRLILSCTVFLAIGFTTWTMLQAQYSESFSQFPACHTVALDRVA